MKLLTEKKAFYFLWSGQSLSLLGSGLTRFALMIWAYQNNNSITSMVLLGFFSYLTFMIISPFAGVVTDRVNRKWVMFFGDLGSGLVTAILLILSLKGHMHIWHLYLAEGLSGAFEAFQSPAFYSSISQLVPKKDFTRANAMIGLSKSAVQVVAPALSSVLLTFSGLNLVMSIDLVTLGLGLATLSMIRMHKPEQSEIGTLARGNFWHEFRFGFRYIFANPGLKVILLNFVGINLFAGFTYMSILSPMILTRTGGNKIGLGTIQTIMGLGGIIGSLVLVAMKTPRKKASLFAWATLISFGTCDLLTAGSHTILGWSISGFLSEFSIPFMVNPYYSIWQETVPGDVQGKVFSVREMIQVSPSPVGYLLGGLMADHVFEPFFMHQNFLTPLVGMEPGSGMAAMFLVTGFFGALNGLVAVLHPAVRKLDQK